MTRHNNTPSAGGGPAQSRRVTPRKEEATMTTSTKVPDIRELKPRITVIGVGGAGGNAVNNMIASGLQGCEFVVANTDAQALTSSKAQHIIQMGVHPAWRGQRIAAALVTRSLRSWQEEGKDTVLLHVNINNPGVIHLYQQLGFVIIRRRGRFQRIVKPNQ